MKNIKNIKNIQELRELASIELVARRVVEGFITGMHKSPFHGFSVEFAEHRLYNAGEAIKNIDWKLYGKTDKLFVKRYEEETNLRCHILIDTSSSMLFPYKKKIDNKLSFSIYSAAALIHLLKKQRDAAGVTLFSDTIEFQSKAKLNSKHIYYLFAQLEKLLHNKQPLKKKTVVAKTLHQIADNIHKRSLVIIFSDMMEHEKEIEIFDALQHLRHNKHEVILFHVRDKKLEQEFEFENRPYRFVDMETGEEIKLNPNNVRDVYKDAIANFFNKMKLKCGQYNIDFIEADVNQDFKKVLIPFLIKRKKLY